MSDININIYGGSNQILPNATKAEQHIYGDKLAEHVLSSSNEGLPLSEEAQRLAKYINNVEDLKGYLAMLSACTTAKDIGEVAAVMAQKEPRLTKDEICKSRFISLLPPLAPKVTDGITVDNLRIHIDNAVAMRRKSGNIR